MILLDTNAVLWLHRGHSRARSLLRRAERIYASPVSALELAFLAEVGKLRLKQGVGVSALMADERWLIDEPPVSAWFSRAIELDWTRDPFDRLLSAHALLRDWKLATADQLLLEQLPARNRFEL